MSNGDEIARLTTDPSLADHKRHGKRLIAPWNQGSLNLRASDWKLHRLPEIIWIAELIAEIGVDRALEILIALVDAVNHSRTTDEPVLPIFASYWHHTSPEAIKSVRDAIKAKRFASDLKQGLQGFYCIHPSYPACRLLGRAKINGCRARYVYDFAKRFVPLLSRFSLPSVALHALITKSLVSAGTLVFPNGMPPIKLELAFQPNADETDPEFEFLAGFVRSTVNSFFGVVEERLERVAPKIFWQQNLSLGSCYEFPSEFQHLANQ